MLSSTVVSLLPKPPDLTKIQTSFLQRTSKTSKKLITQTISITKTLTKGTSQNKRTGLSSSLQKTSLTSIRTSKSRISSISLKLKSSTPKMTLQDQFQFRSNKRNWTITYTTIRQTYFHKRTTQLTQSKTFLRCQTNIISPPLPRTWTRQLQQGRHKESSNKQTKME